MPYLKSEKLRFSGSKCKRNRFQKKAQNRALGNYRPGCAQIQEIERPD
jgi:hypothetical protein